MQKSLLPDTFFGVIIGVFITTLIALITIIIFETSEHIVTASIYKVDTVYVNDSIDCFKIDYCPYYDFYFYNR